jgi:hypothetical protein
MLCCSSQSLQGQEQEATLLLALSRSPRPVPEASRAPCCSRRGVTHAWHPVLTTLVAPSRRLLQSLDGVPPFPCLRWGTLTGSHMVAL